MTQHTGALGRIGQVAVPVRTVERARAFYRDVLGIPFLFDAPGMAFFDAAGVRLMLTEPEASEFEPPGSILYFVTDDIDAEHGRLRSLGVNFREEPRCVHRTPGVELWLAAFGDGEGNTLAIMEERSV